MFFMLYSTTVRTNDEMRALPGIHGHLSCMQLYAYIEVVIIGSAIGSRGHAGEYRGQLLACTD